MNAAERRDFVADIIEAAHGKGAALSIVKRRGKVAAQIWSARGGFIGEEEATTERAALLALVRRLKAEAEAAKAAKP